MALGTILREAREQQGFSAAQVAEATHMMVQMVEELDREDFHRIAAPIYGRGFVKLYAEFLNIDAEPLVKEFNEIFSNARRPVVATRAVKSADPAPVAAPAAVAAGAPVAAGTAVTAGAPVATGTAVTAAAAVSAGTVGAGSAGSSGGTAAPAADELDDLFGHRPAAPAAKAAPAANAGTMGTIDHRRPRSTTVDHGSRSWKSSNPVASSSTPVGVASRCRDLADAVARGWRRFLRRLEDALPAGWRAGPVLAGVAAGLLVIAAIVVISLSYSSSSSSSIRQSSRQGSRQGLEGLPASDSSTPLVINTILPPPEPYVD